MLDPTRGVDVLWAWVGMVLQASQPAHATEVVAVPKEEVVRLTLATASKQQRDGALWIQPSDHAQGYYEAYVVLPRRTYVAIAFAPTEDKAIAPLSWALRPALEQLCHPAEGEPADPILRLGPDDACEAPSSRILFHLEVESLEGSTPWMTYFNGEFYAYEAHPKASSRPSHDVGATLQLTTDQLASLGSQWFTAYLQDGLERPTDPSGRAFPLPMFHLTPTALWWAYDKPLDITSAPTLEHMVRSPYVGPQFERRLQHTVTDSLAALRGPQGLAPRIAQALKHHFGKVLKTGPLYLDDPSQLQDDPEPLSLQSSRRP